MGDQRAEARLTLAPVQILGQRGTLDGQRHLRGERHEGVDELARQQVGDDRTRTPRPSSRAESGRRSTASALEEPELASESPRAAS